MPKVRFLISVPGDAMHRQGFAADSVWHVSDADAERLIAAGAAALEPESVREAATTAPAPETPARKPASRGAATDTE